MRHRLALASCLLLILGQASADFSFNGSYRLRYELLDNTFRALGPTGTDDIVVHRLILEARWEGGNWYSHSKLYDSRAWDHEPLSPVGTGDVNTFNFADARIGWRSDDDNIDASVGRHTLNIGSRRLVTENVYRNTTNVFTGARMRWTTGDTRTDFFWGTPSIILPNVASRGRLRDNRYDADYDSLHMRFWSANVSHGLGKARLEFLLTGLKETDRPGIPTRDRDLTTGGVRLLAEPTDWRIDAELMVQSGKATQNVVTSRLLDVNAWYLHLEARYDFMADLQLRLQYDYGTGDEDITDGDYGRFDALFNARPIDLVPTGMFGVISRGNINSPAIALLRNWETDGGHSWHWMAEYRPAWLASNTDAIPGTGLIDPTGASGSFMGHVFNFRGRWRHGALDINPGVSYIAKGEFMTDSPLATNTENTLYFHTQVEVFF